MRIELEKDVSSCAAKVFLLLSALILLAAFGAHIASFFPIPISMKQVWPIHIAIFVPFLAMLRAINRTHPEIKDNPDDGWLEKRRKRNAIAQNNLKKIIKRCPHWVFIFSVFLISYVFINFFLFIGELKQGSPKEIEGIFYISDHGKIISEIDENEYNKLQAYEVRGFSGHWMLFSFIPFVYFRFIHRKDKDVTNNFCAMSSPSGDI